MANIGEAGETIKFFFCNHYYLQGYEVVCNRFIIICDCIIIRRPVLEKRPDYELCVFISENL